MKTWIRLSLPAVVLTLSVSAGLACDQKAPAADAKDANGAKVEKGLVANAPEKGCDMPCCAHASAAADVKNAANTAGAKPCAAHDAKGCPKKATATATAATAEPAKDTAKAAPAASPGTHR